MKKRFNIGILTVFFFFLPWVLSAQKVTVSVRNVPISRAIAEIQKVSGYSIVVKSEGLDLQRVVSLSLENEDIEPLLTKLFEGQSIEMSINGRNIYVSRKALALPPPSRGFGDGQGNHS